MQHTELMSAELHGNLKKFLLTWSMFPEQWAPNMAFTETFWRMQAQGTAGSIRFRATEEQALQKRKQIEADVLLILSRRRKQLRLRRRQLAVATRQRVR
jgi:hypothetical protein